MTNFKISAVDQQIVHAMSEELGLPRFVCEILVNRNIKTAEDARRFMSTSLDLAWASPYEIPGMRDVVNDLGEAIRKGRHILVFGDFDLDGISATCVLTRGLRDLGAHATPFIPDRFTEGYGLSIPAFDRALSQDPDIELVVTVDCGIACKEAVSAIQARGIDVLITDHHVPGDTVPTGVPIADPKLDENCKSSILAGVGVACKVLCALYSKRGKPYRWKQYCDLATLGTVADLMPMRGENRALVAEGLHQINTKPRPCLEALLQVSRATDQALTASNMSFSITPRLNAAGRMGKAELALDLLMCDDYEQALKLAKMLENTNDKRRKIEGELSCVALGVASAKYTGQRALVVWGEGWHEGVKGIVANRLVSKYGVPSILFTVKDGEARGSGRTVGSVNLFEAVQSCSDLLTRFGGHAAAVGVTLPEENLEEFDARLCEFMQQYPMSAFHPTRKVDAVVNLGELSVESIQQLELLAPFGQENEVPLLLAPDVFLEGGRAVGVDKNHFSCTLTDGQNNLSGILFNCADSIDELMNKKEAVHAMFTAEINIWRGTKSAKAMLKDVVAADPLALHVSEPQSACGEECAAHAPLRCAALESTRLIELKKNREKWAALAGSAGCESSAKGSGGANGAGGTGDACGEDALTTEIVRAIIGTGILHDSQVQALEYLNAGLSTLAIMATGRGKSLIFQVHATRRALTNNEVSLFVYPLRALIADQEYHLSRALASFGIRAVRLTGETSQQDRARIYADLKAGNIDIILTTPEYLCIHAQDLSAACNFKFVVIDEAHHIGGAKSGNRPAYARIKKALCLMGDPLILALTATASNNVANDILEILPIQKCVFDASSRDNLIIDDQRNLRSRNEYLERLVETGEKTVVYVNSRAESVALTRILRNAVPNQAPYIGFYNAALHPIERKRVEALFRDDVLRVLISTSAFGEGVNIPNVRHVVLYHLPFSDIEFNQMAGRAGRDGNPSVIHLLFGRADASINRHILQTLTPGHEAMACVYRGLREMQRAHAGASFETTVEDVARASSTKLNPLTASSAQCGVSVFSELGLINSSEHFRGGKSVISVSVVEGAARVQLTDSIRYREGTRDLTSFDAFCDWALTSSGPDLRERIAHPITPDESFAVVLNDAQNNVQK